MLHSGLSLLKMRRKAMQTTREEHIKNMKDVRDLATDYIPLQFCLKMIADALIFLLQGVEE